MFVNAPTTQHLFLEWGTVFFYLENIDADDTRAWRYKCFSSQYKDMHYKESTE